MIHRSPKTCTIWRRTCGEIPNRDIDALENYWRVFHPAGRTVRARRSAGIQPGEVAAGEVKRTILDHAEFAAFRKRIAAVFDLWNAAHETALKQMKQGVKAKS